MPATVINYLYEDLPEGHTVLASEWNTAMHQIKETINLHAILIGQKNMIPFTLTIGYAPHQWIYDKNLRNPFYYVIPASLHNKGTIPQVEVYEDESYINANNEIVREKVYPNITLTPNGDVRIASNCGDALYIVIV